MTPEQMATPDRAMDDAGVRHFGGLGTPRPHPGERVGSQRKLSAVTRLTSVTASAGMPARLAAATIASGLGAS